MVSVRRASLLAAIVLLWALLPVPGAAGAAAPPDSPPIPEEGMQAPAGKNSVAPPESDPDGITQDGLAAAGTKGYDPEAVAADHDGLAAAPGAVGGRFLACGSSGASYWQTTSAALVPIRSCTLTLGESGFVYINASASAGLSSDGLAYEARFRLGIDSPLGNAGTDRWIDVRTDPWDGTDRPVSVMLPAWLAAGRHTFYFLGSRSVGEGTVHLYSPSLSVFYLPATVGEVKACGAAGDAGWKTARAAFQAIRSCTLTVPETGYVFLSGSAGVGLASPGAPYDGRFRLGIDIPAGTGSSERRVDVAADGADGTDETLATSLLTLVQPGRHTFYLSGLLAGGAGPVQLHDPALSVIYFPTSAATLRTCGAAGGSTWESTGLRYDTIGACALTAPRDGFAFVEASASVGLAGNRAESVWEGQFRLLLDGKMANATYDRYVDVNTDVGGDGGNRVLVDSGLMTVRKGFHTFSLVGRRWSGPGTMRLYAPTITVLVPGSVTYSPLVVKH